MVDVDPRCAVCDECGTVLRKEYLEEFTEWVDWLPEPEVKWYLCGPCGGEV